MSDKVWVGRNAMSLETAPAFDAYTGVRLWYDDEQYFFAGDETGRVLEADNPWATQEMADNILASIAGYSYHPYEAAGAILDPAAELGDGVTVGGVYGQLATINTTFDALMASDISAPADEEIDHEYPYLSPAEREYKRNKARTYSLISKTSEEIKLAVTGLQNESQVNSLISQAMDKIELSVSSSKGSTSLKLTSNGVEIDSDTVDLSVKALNISGLIQAEQIKLTGSITWDDLTSEAKSRVDQGKGDDNPGYIETSYIGKTKIMSPSIYGGQFYATGQGAYDGPAYYIYNGCDISGGDADLGELLGYISYDNNGAGTEIEAKERVFFRTLDDVALKIQAGGNISVESDSGYVYFGSPIRAGNGLNVRGSFGTSLPSFGEKGDLFFLIE